MRRLLVAAALVAVAVPALPARAAGCATSSGVAVLTPKGLTATLVTPGTPVVGSAAGSDTSTRFRLDLGSVKKTAPVRVTLSWGNAASDFDLAVTDVFGYEHGRSVATGTAIESVTLPPLASCDDVVLVAKNKAGSPAETLTATLAVGSSPVGKPVALPRAGWTALAPQGPGDTGNTGLGDPVENAFDGKLGTRWSSRLLQNPAEFFQLDTGKASTFSRLSLVTGPSPGDQPAEFTVALSDDMVSWRHVGGGTGRAVTDVRFAQQTARYVRISLTGATFPNWWSIAEAQLFKDPCFSRTAGC